jgi:hypothetical protein
MHWVAGMASAGLAGLAAYHVAVMVAAPLASKTKNCKLRCYKALRSEVVGRWAELSRRYRWFWGSNTSAQLKK